MATAAAAPEEVAAKAAAPEEAAAATTTTTTTTTTTAAPEAQPAPVVIPDLDKMVTLKGLSDITFKMYADSVTTSALSLLFGTEIKKLSSNGCVTKALKDGRFTGLVPGSIYHVVMKPQTHHQQKKHPYTPDEARLLFRKFDADGNGSIDKEEWRKLARSVNINMADADLDKMFMIVDTDANGTIEYDEFERWFCGDLGEGDRKLKRLIVGMGVTMRMLPASDLDDVLDIFVSFDKDNSGTIDPAEFRDLTCDLGLRMSPEKTEEMFKAIDIDGNGTLDFQEFLAWYVASTQEASDGKTDQFLHNVKDKFRKFKLSKKEEPKKEEEKEKAEEEGDEEEAPKKKKKSEGEEKSKDAEKPKAKEEIPAGWHAISNFHTGWSSVAEEPAELCVSGKFVRMRGCVTSTKSGKIFTLPEGCAPAAVERFPCTKRNGAETKVVPVTVDKNGNVYAAVSDGNLCLSSISFFAM